MRALATWTEPSSSVQLSTISPLRARPFSGKSFVLNDAQTALTLNPTDLNMDFPGAQTPDPNDNPPNAPIHAPAPPGANAPVGPPLERIGTRGFIAGVLPNTTENMVRWLRHPQAVNPPPTRAMNIPPSRCFQRGIGSYAIVHRFHRGRTTRR